MKCIYCLKTERSKGVTFKKREHVIPQGLGLFGSGTFTLHGKVCDSCNGRLGAEIDIILARDSIEGLAYREKYNKQLGSPKGKQRVRLTLPDTPALGEFAGLVLDKDLFFNQHITQQASQVRLYEKGATRPTILLHEELEAIEPLDKDRYDLKRTVVNPIDDDDEKNLIALINQKGIPFKPSGKVPMPPRSNAHIIGFVAAVDSYIKRGLAKIALGYACYVYPGLDLTTAEFNETRKFIAKGKGDVKIELKPKQLAQETERTRVITNGILITAEVINGALVVWMRLYDLQDYQVWLGKVSNSLPSIGYSMRPGESPVLLHSSKRGSGLYFLTGELDPLRGPYWRARRL
jgi:hypothetical protein